MDHLDTATWLPQAEKLNAGQSKRIDHDCGPGRTLKVSRTDKGFDAWCWRCGCGGFAPGPTETWQDRIARIGQARNADQSVKADLTLPQPMNRDPRTWPLKARVWLYKAGLSNDEIARHGFYYHETTQRIVIPVWSEDHRILYWQARGFDPERAKYINPKADRSSLVAKYEPPTVVGEELPLVLTEDILSAVRVSAVSTAWAILGTSIPPAVAAGLVKTGRPVSIWLDPDAAGRRGTAKIVKPLRAYGVPFRIISTDKDPKYYSEQEIRSILSA